MQLPSINHIIQKSTSTLKRFPLALLSASIAVVIAIGLIETPGAENNALFNVILVSLLGIPLFTVIKLISEKRSWSGVAAAGTQVFGVLLLTGYYFLLPGDLDYAPYSHIYRYMLYVIGIHLLVAIGPYVMHDDVHAFWQYNKTIFLRFLTAVFFSGVLFAGLSIALLSIDVLLGISINDERYLQLFIFLGGIFNTWFFLAGIPSSIEKFGVIDEYPKGLKIFTQNILIPLVVIYVVILYLYAGKILLQWSWPEGWVAILILSFSIAGILALLLLYPIQDRVENRWIKRFSTTYFWALVPLVILLLLAIYRRVWEYGITVERYFVILLGFWLAGIVVYFLFSKAKNIKVIPGSLCIIAFLISFGPWGAFSISEQSQINRLESYLTQNNILQGGAIQKTTEAIPDEDQNQISSIVLYLHNTHGLDGLQPWFKRDLDSLTTNNNEQDTTSTQPVNHYNRPRYMVEKLMGLEYSPGGRYASPAVNRHRFYSNQNNVLAVQDIDWVLQDLTWTPNSEVQEYKLPNGNSYSIEATGNEIRIYRNGEEANSVTVDIVDLINRLSERYTSEQEEIPSDDMIKTFSADSFSVTVYFKRIEWTVEQNRVTPTIVQFDIGLK